MTVSTAAQLIAEIASDLPSGNPTVLTAASLRTVLGDMVASLQANPTVNAQTGTTYTFVVADLGKFVSFNNASTIAATLPQAAGSFAAFNCLVKNIGAGAVTITPTTSTINGSASYVLATGLSIFLISDGTNYQIIPWQLPQSRFAVVSRSVNFNSGNADTSIPINIPVGISRYVVTAVRIANASHDLSTATAGLFTAAAGGGVAIVAGGSAITVTATTANTNNNTQSMTVANGTTESYDVTTLFFRVGTAEGTAATADVIIELGAL